MSTLNIKSYKKLYIQLVSDEYGVLQKVKEHFTTYKEGFLYSPKYKSGLWDGTITVFNWAHKTLPYGLLLETIKFIKKEYPNTRIIVDDDVTAMFKGVEIPYKYDLSLKPREYQRDCIESCLRYSKGIIVSSTASGKSLLIAYIIKHLLDNKICKKALIIVPTIQLVSQFYSDLNDYGLGDYTIGVVWSKVKEWDKSITISTWQSLSNHHEMLSIFDCVICDETHLSRAREIMTILRKATNAFYRLGFTGTMPTSILDNWNIKSFLGPIIREYGPGQLSQLGFVSKCNVHIYNIKYPDEFSGSYSEVQDMVFSNRFRLATIRNMIEECDNSVLILVGKVDKEGKVLQSYLSEHLSDREVFFIWGDTPVKEREYWRKEMENRRNIVLIATYQIFATGINIPSLKYLILASPYKSKIRVLQSIGRTLRLHAEKLNGSHVYDIIDHTKYFLDHGTKRAQYYSSEGFNIIETDLTATNLQECSF